MNNATKNMVSARYQKSGICSDAIGHAAPNERLILARRFYNKILGKSTAFLSERKHISPDGSVQQFTSETIQDDKKYLKPYRQTRCKIEYRLLKTHQNFFRITWEENRKAGFPGFGSKDTNINAPIDLPKVFIFNQTESHIRGENSRSQHKAVPKELRTDKTYPLRFPGDCMNAEKAPTVYWEEDATTL